MKGGSEAKMIEVIFKDGTSDEFLDANLWTSEGYPDDFIGLVKRTYDEDEDYDEGDDKEVCILNINEIRCVKLK